MSGRFAGKVLGVEGPFHRIIGENGMEHLIWMPHFLPRRSYVFGATGQSIPYAVVGEIPPTATPSTRYEDSHPERIEL